MADDSGSPLRLISLIQPAETILDGCCVPDWLLLESHTK